MLPPEIQLVHLQITVPQLWHPLCITTHCFIFTTITYIKHILHVTHSQIHKILLLCTTWCTNSNPFVKGHITFFIKQCLWHDTYHPNTPKSPLYKWPAGTWSHLQLYFPYPPSHHALNNLTLLTLTTASGGSSCSSMRFVVIKAC